MISIIAAVSSNSVIGFENIIPWHISEDLKRFKELTLGHHVIMGRKTFESLNSTPLPNRVNIVVSNNSEIKNCCNNVIITNSLKAALLKSSPDAETFIIGGGQIYKQGLDFAQKIYMTHIYKNFDGDVYFPEIDMNKWEVSEYIGNFYDAKSDLIYSYITYQRKN